MGAVKLNKRTIDRLTVERASAVFWDSELPGFGIRVHATGRKVFIAQARTPGGLPKRATVGRYEDVDPEDARPMAAEMIDRIRRGRDPMAPPAPEELTVADLATRFMAAHVEVNCKPRTVETYRSLLRHCILPGLGDLRLSEVDRSHVSALHHGLRDTPSRANQSVGIFSKMFKLAVAWGMTPARPNPCRSIKRYKERSCERFLTEDEYARLGRVLFEAEAEGRPMASAVAAVRLLLLTGCRRNEILMLRWDDVDLAAREMRLRDAKTGPRTVQLSPAAALAHAPRVEGNPHVVPGIRPVSRMGDLQRPWERIRKRAGLDGLRLHDCRHSFASRALALGESLPTIGKLLGHSHIQTTARYAHLARDSVHESARRVSESVEASLYRDCPGLAAAR